MADPRLLLIGPTPPPTGGIASHVAALRRALARLGAAAAIADPARGRLRLLAELGRAAAIGARAHVHVCGHNRPSYTLIAACAAAAPGRPPIVTLHSGLAPAWLRGLGRPGRTAIARVLARSAHVVCVSPALAEVVLELGLSAGHVTVASPFLLAGLRPGRLPARAAAARAAFPVLVAATVAPGLEYGADVLVGGFARLAALVPDSGLIVYGPGGADRDVARALATRGLEERVVAAGELAGSEAQAVVAASDVFVRPTRGDGDAVSVREARALGRRVVASDAALRPAGTVIFAAGDARALAGALRAALAAPPPPAELNDGLAPLASVYARVGLHPRPEKEPVCAASPDA